MPKSLERTAAPLGRRTVRVIRERRLQPTGRFRRRSLSWVVRPLYTRVVNNKQKQLIVLMIGLTLVLGGALIRLTIRHHWFREPLCLLISFGQTRFSTQAPYADAVEAVSTMGLGVFFAGLALVVISIGAWLVLPSWNDTNHDNERTL